jgi:hypothetical protein
MPTYPVDPMWSFPVTAALEFDTAIAAGKNGTEQRWMRNTGRASWTLPYPYLSLAQRDVLLNFFDTQKGSAELFDFPFLGTTYVDCYFDQDELTATESESMIFAAEVRICKVVRTPDATALAANFPALASGARMQRPYTHARTWDTVSVRTEGGRFAYSNRAATLRTWTAGGSVLTLADALAIWNHFSRAQGRYKSFTFTDPDADSTHTARFASDRLEWRFTEPGAHSIQVGIQELI